jgi:hypothetical protein
MIELIFAIVVIGILAKFGVEFLSQAYRSFIYTNVNHTLQSQSEGAVELIASKLQYRIKDSVIARHNSNDFYPIGQLNPAQINNYDTLEWIGEDVEGFRGIQSSLWSGIFDLDASSAALLISPATNTIAINANIDALSDSNSSLNTDAVLYFVGSDSDITQMGWQGRFTDPFDATVLTFNGAIANQNQVIHPIQAGVNGFASRVAVNFSGVDINEYYKLAWTAYAIKLENYNNNKGDLFLYYDYQPWNGENFTAGKKTLLARNVSTFRFIAMSSLLKIQVCIKSDLITNEEHSICKDKTVF